LPEETRTRKPAVCARFARANTVPFAVAFATKSSVVEAPPLVVMVDVVRLRPVPSACTVGLPFGVFAAFQSG
jgi:hypothetical protein